MDVAGPPFIRNSPTASLRVIVKFWAPTIGQDEATLLQAALFRLMHCRAKDWPGGSGEGCCGRMVVTLSYGRMPACRYYLLWAANLPVSLYALTISMSKDLLCDADCLAWLATELGVALPPWFGEWREAFPSAQLEMLLAPAPFAPVSPPLSREWHPFAIERLRQEGSPAGKTGGWGAFVERVKRKCRRGRSRKNGSKPEYARANETLWKSVA